MTKIRYFCRRMFMWKRTFVCTKIWCEDKTIVSIPLFLCAWACMQISLLFCLSPVVETAFLEVPVFHNRMFQGLSHKSFWKLSNVLNDCETAKGARNQLALTRAVYHMCVCGFFFFNRQSSNSVKSVSMVNRKQALILLTHDTVIDGLSYIGWLRCSMWSTISRSSWRQVYTLNVAW